MLRDKLCEKVNAPVTSAVSPVCDKWNQCDHVLLGDRLRPGRFSSIVVVPDLSKDQLVQTENRGVVDFEVDQF